MNVSRHFVFSTKIKSKKDVFSSCHERGTKKNSESPQGIEPQTFRFRAPKVGGSTPHGTQNFFFVPRS